MQRETESCWVVTNLVRSAESCETLVEAERVASGTRHRLIHRSEHEHEEAQCPPMLEVDELRRSLGNGNNSEERVFSPSSACVTKVRHFDVPASCAEMRVEIAQGAVRVCRLGEVVRNVERKGMSSRI